MTERRENGKGDTSMRIRTKKRIGDEIYKWLIFIILFLYSISLLVPIIWTLINSFKGNIDFLMNAFSWPSEWVFSNYVNAYQKVSTTVRSPEGGLLTYGFFGLMINSFIISGLTPLVVVIFTAMVTYILSRYKFVGNKLIFGIGIVVMILPIVGSLPSGLTISKALGVYNNLPASILTAPSNIFGLNFLILYGAFKGVPMEYSEAAQIDGAGPYTVMFRVIMPIMIPTIAVLYTLAFLSSWNDYLTPMIWLPSYPNLAYGMYYFQRNATVTMPEILAGFVILMLPTVILYLSMQKLIVAKFSVGGLKG